MYVFKYNPDSAHIRSYKDTARGINLDAYMNLSCLPTYEAQGTPAQSYSTPHEKSEYDSCDERTPSLSPAPRWPDYLTDPPNLSDLKRTGDNGVFVEQSDGKRAKLHNKKRIITGSGEVEFWDAVCPVHADADISLPLPDCAECLRVNKLVHEEIDAYEAWLLYKHEGKKRQSGTERPMRRWLRTRSALANYKVELEDAQLRHHIPRSSLHLSRSSQTADVPQKSVLFDPICHADENIPRRPNEFCRECVTIQPGNHGDPKSKQGGKTSNP